MFPTFDKASLGVMSKANNASADDKLDFETKKFLRELKPLLRCPSAEKGPEGTETLRECLLELWVWVVANYPYQVRSEGSLAERYFGYDDHINPATSEDDWDLNNLRTWIEDARDIYISTAWPILKMNILGPDERQKHWPKKNVTNERVRQLSLSGESLFFCRGVGPVFLEGVLWALMARRFEDFLNRKHRFIFVDIERSIGASHGQDVTWVCFDIDYSLAVAHTYPVPEQEIPANAPTESLTSLGLALKGA